MHIRQFEISLHHEVKEKPKGEIAKSHQVTHWFHDVPRQIAKSAKPYKTQLTNHN